MIALPVTGSVPAVYRPSQRPSFRLRILPSPLALRFAISRTLVFQLGCLYILPAIIGSNGIWLSVTVAEVLAVLVAAYYVVKNRGKNQHL